MKLLWTASALAVVLTAVQWQFAFAHSSMMPCRDGNCSSTSQTMGNSLMQVSRAIAGTRVMPFGAEEEEDPTRKTLEGSEEGFSFLQALSQRVQIHPHEFEATLPKLQQFATSLVNGTKKFSEQLSEEQRKALRILHNQTDTFLNETYVGHHEDQKEVDRARDAFLECRPFTTAADDEKAVVLQKEIAHDNCRTAQKGLLSTKEKNCNALAKAEESPNLPTCMETFPKSPLSKQDKALMKSCLRENLLWAIPYNQTLFRLEAECTSARLQLESKAKECDAVQQSYENAFCAYHKELTSSCDSYATCYTSKEGTQQTIHEDVKKAEKGRKSTLKAAKRVKCILTALDSHPGELQKTLDKCTTAGPTSTASLDITYHALPVPGDCDKTAVSTHPCMPKWSTSSYAVKAWHGKVTTASCTQCEHIPTTTTTAAPTPLSVPTECKSGSPSSCTITEVKLIGKYVPGPLIIVKGGLQVSRSTAPNSCPEGWKIWAPTNQEDMKTVFKSTNNFKEIKQAGATVIVDVTKPDNGCGGCTRYAMNSKVKQQSMWRTTDGRSWFLRATPTGEPNGDYFANCYLSLNPNYLPPNTHFNDASTRYCYYKASHYLCQRTFTTSTTTTTAAPQPLRRSQVSTTTLRPFTVPTECKSGSPSSCTITEVKLVGKYVPGALIVVKGGLKVSRSTAPNSCPEGWKIWAATNQEDMKTVFDSTNNFKEIKNLGATVIVDVTKPSKGCGGCTGYAMNSKVKQQSMWRTTDNRSWFLRATKYGEPNGDYSANCYMALFPNYRPPNEAFNDGWCHYGASHYLCQPVKDTFAFTTSTTTTITAWNPSTPVPTECKSKSPSSCTITEVKLVGKYVPGSLIIVKGGLEVSRSTAPNSCPEGWKIWAPTNQEDMKTVFDSTNNFKEITKLGATVIVDVTKPSNGCGGCTGYAMNSKVKQQSMWRTTDNRSWFLRATKYGEPNGDYTANCYLRLYPNHRPPNVAFNDAWCHYKASHYLCQPAKQR